ncbi:MAG: copper-translocating P-type ATPase [Dehalococcoidales bacterium]|nr:copper-translocating P-type ATPase [Dehalococcoidales bacterium]
MDRNNPEEHHHPDHGSHGATIEDPAKRIDRNQAKPASTDHMEHQHMQAEPGKWPEETERAARREHHNHHAMMIADYRRRFWISLIITIPILILSPIIQQFLRLGDNLRFSGDLYVLFALSSVVYFYGGYPFLKGIVDEIKSRSPGMMTLIAVAITVAYIYSSAVVFGLPGEIFFWELATLIVIMLLGHWLEMKSIMAASSALEELARLLPSEAHRLMPDGNTRDIPLDDLRIGDLVLVKPGENVPADGIVLSGETSVNEAMLTGESVPVAKVKDDRVIGGSVNGEGSISVEVQKTGADSYLAQVTELVRQAQGSKSRTQNLANRAALVLVLVALLGGLITVVAWVGIIGQSFVFGLTRMVTVMVIACPHALGLAIPLVVAVSTAISAKSGLLIKNRDGFEQARNIRAVLFDKTGTLTQGKFGITDIITLNREISPDELLKYTASVEQHSEHPIAKGIVASAKDSYPVENFKAIPGKGAQGLVNGKEVMAVSPGYLKEKNIQVNDERLNELASQGKTVIFTLIDGQLAGAIALADIIRPESRQAIAEIKAMGIRCMMITGDNRQVAQWVAQEVGLDEYFAEVIPEKKAEKVKEVQSRGIKVAMTGDGVNDAPALAQADVGIAIGAGTDVAVATADVVLVKSNPLDVVSIIKLSRATYRKMVQNLGWATGYNVIAIPLAAGVAYSAGILLDPAMGAALMAASTIIVAINARFLRVEK